MLPSPSDRYRPDIDGLRAIAVLLVVIFHAFPEAVPGGFIGVDVFFVISGFLITGIIARELDSKRFSLLGFYDRRVRRIFPALIVVLAAVLVLGWLCMLPDAYTKLSSDVFASAAFSANIALLLQSGYFDIESAKKPLLHLWSLGIEEQFYLVWPLILMLAWRLRLNLLWVAVSIGLASFVLNVALIRTNPTATFYLPFTRAFELLAGAALACAWGRLSQGVTASNWRAGAGIALIAAAAAILDSKSAFPGWWALLPVAGAVLLLSAPGAWVCRYWLASRPMQWIGKISYPLYLWHWPLLVFFAIIKFIPLTLLERALIVGLSVLLAWATTRFVERPFRFGRPMPIKAFGLCAGMLLIAAGGGAVVAGDGFGFRLPPQIRAIADVHPPFAKWRLHDCMLALDHDTSFGSDCVDQNRRPLIFVWGDSTAAALMPGLRKAQQSHEFGIAQYTSSACIPAMNADIARSPHCHATNDTVLKLLAQTKPDIVLLHGYWEEHFEDHVAETVTAVKQLTGARVVVLGRVPYWKRELPNEAMRFFMLHHRLIPARYGNSGSNAYDSVLRAKLLPLGAEFISAWDALCNADGCLTRVGDQADDLSTSDEIHLTEKGSIALVRSIIDAVLNPQATPATGVSQ
jgi:peptidoglycan/LPS O-acetylase OafA/YrhL